MYMKSELLNILTFNVEWSFNVDLVQSLMCEVENRQRVVENIRKIRVYYNYKSIIFTSINLLNYYLLQIWSVCIHNLKCIFILNT